ncbi:hypothetical protein [Proteiniclasticum ruminis]|uniref:hypothetical protein n=1 Tax=Proteiniclasticum ruminis TaxID=398199 RepID=UPI0012DF11FD|nr:hypothetical protein [Proteiniclasticum ruminis]
MRSTVRPGKIKVRRGFPFYTNHSPSKRISFENLSIPTLEEIKSKELYFKRYSIEGFAG